MANAGRRRRPLFVRIKWCQVEMEINIFPEHGHTSGVIIRNFPASLGWNPREEIYGDFSAAKDWLVRTCGATRDTGLNTYGIRGRESVEREEEGEGEGCGERRVHRRWIWYSRREEGITSWEDSPYPRDLVNRCAGPRNFKPRADTFDSRAISSGRSELADSTSWHTSYFTYVIFFTRSAWGTLSKTVISSSRGPFPAQFCTVLESIKIRRFSHLHYIRYLIIITTAARKVSDWTRHFTCTTVNI